MVGRVIGRGGETVKGLQATTGARIQIDQTAVPCVVTITGNPRCVEAASRAVADVVRGGSTAAYSAVNVNRREAMASYSMYQRHAGRHAAGPVPYAAGLGAYGAGPQYGGVSSEYGGVSGAQSMAQLEHQFSFMGYAHTSRGGHVNMGMGPGHPYGVGPPFARGASAYGYGPSDAFGYGGDPGAHAYAHGAEYAMQMAQMQAHMMGTQGGPGPGPGPGPGGGTAGGPGGGGVPPGGAPMGPGPDPNPGAWMSHEQMAQMAQFQQEMMVAQAQHMGAFARGGGSSAEGQGPGPARDVGRREFPGGTAYEQTVSGTEAQTGQTTAGALSGQQGPGSTGPSPPAGPRPRPRPTEGDTAWNPPRPL
jgi:hypothetical protein